MTITVHVYDKERWETIVSDCDITLDKRYEDASRVPEAREGYRYGIATLRNAKGETLEGKFSEKTPFSFTTANFLSLGWGGPTRTEKVRAFCDNHPLLPEIPDAPLVTPPSQEDPC